MSQWGPTQLQGVFYGRGSVKRLNDALRSACKTPQPKAMIVTGRTLASKTPVIKEIENLLGREGHVATFSSISQHAPIKTIQEGLELLKTKDVNVLISVGGGSPIDSAKAMVAFYAKENDGKILKHLAIPTTLSAAEFTQTAGFTSEEGHKTGTAGGKLAPTAVILDPELSEYTPAKLWLSSGVRALDHAVEYLYRKDAQTPLKHLAVGAIHDLFRWLPICKDHPKAIKCRKHLLVAAWQSQFPNNLTTPLGLSHTLGHHLGATYGIPHGICSALTLARTVEALVRNDKLTEKELEWLARAYDGLPEEPVFTDSMTIEELGIGVGSQRKKLPKGAKPSKAAKRKKTEQIAGPAALAGARRKALALVREIDDLVKRLGLSSNLAEYKVPPADFEHLAAEVVSPLIRADVTAALSAEQVHYDILARI